MLKFFSECKIKKRFDLEGVIRYSVFPTLIRHKDKQQVSSLGNGQLHCIPNRQI